MAKNIPNMRYNGYYPNK